jgi:serine/threonine-protein kinase
MRDPLVGRTLGGKYTLDSLIGTGAMGAVYRARHVALDAVVAVKVMHDDIAVDGTFAERFHREARAASRLNHPNVIRVIDFGIEPAGHLYIAMEYVEGIDLYNVIRRDSPLPEERIVDLLAQALSGIAAAHDMGVIHRDLKPENIMVATRVSDDGASYDLVKVCDFGIAQITEPTRPSAIEVEQRTLTVRGVLLGTPQYMSPEQARGEAIDARSDVYSVGVILYQLLTGQLPFEGPTPIDTVLKHISEEAVPPTDVMPSASVRLEAVCMKALAKRRENRWVSAREMRAALRSEPTSTPSRGFAGLPTVSSAGLPSPMPPISLGSGAPTMAGPLDIDAETLAMQQRSPSRATILVATIVGALLLILVIFFAGGDGASPSNGVSAPAPTTVAQAEPPPATLPEPAAPPAPATSGAVESVGRTPPRGQRVSAVIRRVGGGAKGAESAAPPATETPPSEHESTGPSPSAAPPANEGESAALAPKHATGTETRQKDESPSKSPAPSAATPTPFEVRPGAARVHWRVAQVGGGTTSGDVGRALSRAAGTWNGCYERGLRARGRRVEGQGTLHLSCDDQGRVVTASFSGVSMSDVAECVRTSVAGVRIPNADTGEAWATVALTLAVAE